MIKSIIQTEKIAKSSAQVYPEIVQTHSSPNRRRFLHFRRRTPARQNLLLVIPQWVNTNGVKLAYYSDKAASA